MTEKQAIKILKEEKSWESDDRKIDAFIMGIEALEEIQQYRAIGTVEDVKELARNERNKAISDFVSAILQKFTEEERNGNYRFYSCELKQGIADLVEQLKKEGAV